MLDPTGPGASWRLSFVSGPQQGPGVVACKLAICTREIPMSVTETAEGFSGEIAGYGGFADAIGGVATVVLAIIGLSGAYPSIFLGIATIIFGAALLIEGGAMLSEYVRLVFPAGAQAVSMEHGSPGSLSAVFLVGAAGIVLGVLALIGIHPAVLTAAAVIAFGGALVLSSNAVMNLHQLKMNAARMSGTRSGAEILAGEVAAGSTGIQIVAGVAAIVLGILAVVGHMPAQLTLIALIELGATLILTGTSLSFIIMSFMRPVRAP